MTDSHLPPLAYDPSGVMIPETGLSKADLDWLAPQLVAARNEVLDDLSLWHSGEPVPAEKQPLDAAFIDLPERLLEEHAAKGDRSQLARIKTVAAALAEHANQVVVLGIGGSYMGARALFEACCHPYYNLLSRLHRGRRPQILFEGNNVDNDATSGLFDALTGEGPQRWAVVVISKSGGTLETAVAFRLLLEKLREACGGDLDKVRHLIVPITGLKSNLRALCAELKCPETFPIPDGVGGRFSIFTAVGLLPAAVMGLDIVKLLEGAAAINRRFCNSPPGDNPVLDYVGVCHLMEARRGATTRVLSTWGKRLEAVGLWYDQLLAESLGKDGRGALPLTCVNTRDLHSRGQQHQEGHRDKLITNLVVERTRCEPIVIQRSDLDQDQLNQLAGKSLPDILSAALAGTNRAYA
ncbi:MAG TPA: glucose-6-phosphate isomerase, partial [Thermoguttaceae bacterium]|nr:glucose-6-phosphate isomerase [Thermoguttaceae bacterium]